jgi:WD40 repeat protein
LNNLKEIIDRVKSQPSKVNSACTFYYNDENNFITSSTISPNFETISFTSEKSSIFLYKLNQYEKKMTYSDELVGGHTGAIFKSKFTHDSKFLLSCGEDGLACLWNMKKTKLNNKLDFSYYESEQDSEDDEYTNNYQNTSDLSSLTCSYSGHLYSIWDVEIFSRLNLFSTCSKDGTARLWSFDRLYPTRVYCGHQSDVNSVRFHPNGSYLATGSSDKTVRLWSVQSSEFVRLFSGHRSRVFNVAFSPDGNYLASAGEDRKIKIWDLRSGGLYKEFKGHTDIIHSLLFDNNSEILCSGGLDRTVKFWDVHSKNIQVESNSNKLSDNIKSNKSLNSSFTSNELIKSINVDFSVYSINCDIQNVFYFSGAAKKSNKAIIPPSTNINTVEVNKNSLISSPQMKNTNNGEPNLSTMPTHQLKLPIISVIKPSNKIPAKTKKVSSSKSEITSTETTQTIQESKPTINTRRRAAAALLASSSSTTTTTQSIIDNQQDTTSYLFKNNDDLYEV